MTALIPCSVCDAKIETLDAHDFHAAGCPVLVVRAGGQAYDDALAACECPDRLVCESCCLLCNPKENPMPVADLGAIPPDPRNRFRPSLSREDPVMEDMRHRREAAAAQEQLDDALAKLAASEAEVDRLRAELAARYDMGDRR